MNCPPALAEIITAILRTGLLRIRNSGDASRCSLEADHLHNLPALLTNFTPEGLQYYWEAERPAFLRQCPNGEATSFEELWRKLAAWAAPPPPQAAPR
jgi:hypothetical protein